MPRKVMMDKTPLSGSLRPQELEAMYAISRVIGRAVDTDNTLDEIIRMVRPVFIFDNIVLYVEREDGNLEPCYARAIGRGRFREADLAWGESVAYEAYETGQTTQRNEDIGDSNADRTSLRYFLGLPLRLGEQTMGTLVFIRFGGPPYSPDQIHLAEFIVTHVAQLISRQQLVERVADLEARRRLDDLQDDFIAMVSHELLTPLGFIKGYASTLLRDDTTWDESTRREFLTIIDEESDRLRELIDNMMDSSRLQAGTLKIDFQPVNLEALLNDVILRNSSRIENLSIQLDLHKTGLQIQGDAVRLAQVFDNLLNNAVKYAPGSHINLALDADREWVRIEVKDQGPGIPPEHVENVFNRFFRVPGHNVLVRGTGLGLYICRQIVEAHGGAIQVESEVEVGTTFTITLPNPGPKSPGSF